MNLQEIRDCKEKARNDAMKDINSGNTVKIKPINNTGYWYHYVTAYNRYIFDLASDGVLCESVGGVNSYEKNGVSNGK